LGTGSLSLLWSTNKTAIQRFTGPFLPDEALNFWIWKRQGSNNSRERG